VNERGAVELVFPSARLPDASQRKVLYLFWIQVVCATLGEIASTLRQGTRTGTLCQPHSRTQKLTAKHTLPLKQTYCPILSGIGTDHQAWGWSRRFAGLPPQNCKAFPSGVVLVQWVLWSGRKESAFFQSGGQQFKCVELEDVKESKR